MSDWLNCIFNPCFVVGIPKTNVHLFQIYAFVSCDLMWFSRNRAVHDGVIANVLVLSSSINKVSLEHHLAWKEISSPLGKMVSPNGKLVQDQF